MTAGAIACPRCVWERSMVGREAPRLLAVALRAHLEVWHPGIELEPIGASPRGPQRLSSVGYSRRAATAALPVASVSG